MSGVKVSLTLSRRIITMPGDGGGAGRLTFGRIGGVIFFASSSSQSIPLNHGIFLISESPAMPPLQHSRASLSFSTSLNSKHVRTCKTREAAIRSPLSKHLCTSNCIFPSDHGRTQERLPCRCWPSIPDRFAHCMVGLRTSPHTT